MGWLEEHKLRIEQEKRASEERKRKEEEANSRRHADAEQDLQQFFQLKLKELEGTSLKFGPVSFKIVNTYLEAFSGDTKIFTLRFWYDEHYQWEGDCQVPTGEHYLKRDVWYAFDWVNSKGETRYKGHSGVSENYLAEYILFLMDEKK
jgi:hypothetical protein